MFDYYPLPADPNQTAFYNDMADLSLYLEGIIKNHEAKIADYEESSLPGKVWFTITHLFDNDKPYEHAKELSHQVTLLQEMQQNTKAYADKQANIHPQPPVDSYQRDVVDHFFSNNNQFNARSILRLKKDYQDAIDNSRSLFDSDFSDHLKRHSETIDDFAKNYNANQENWFEHKYDGKPLANVFLWLQKFLNITENAFTKVETLPNVAAMNVTQTVAKSPVMTRTEATETQSEKSGIKRTLSIVTPTSVAKNKTTSLIKEESKNLTLTEKVEILEIKTDKREQPFNKIERQVNINKQNIEDNTHEIKKQLQDEQQTERGLNKVAKNQADAKDRIDNARQGYGRMDLNEHNKKIEKNNEYLKEFSEDEKEIDEAHQRMDFHVKDSNEKFDRTMKMLDEEKARKENEKLKQSEKNDNKNESEPSKDERQLADFNMNDVNRQLNAFNNRRFQ